MKEDHQLLKEVPSGKIELVFNGSFSVLQFNCHCLDALPFCKAMCCRLRQGFTVMLQPEEVGHYRSRPHPQNPDLHILQHSADGNACTYLDQTEHKCTIHDHSPKMCQLYHCSPGGKGDHVKHRDGGWVWTPTGFLQQLGDGTVVDVREIARVGKPNPVEQSR